MAPCSVRRICSFTISMKRNNGNLRQNFQAGFTIVELLVYTVSMTLVLAAITVASLHVYGFYAAAVIESRADRAASTVMQVLASEMRAGATIDQSESVFNASLGQLTIEAREGTTAVERVFTVTDGQVTYTEAGTSVPLTPEDMNVSKFRFTQIVTPVSYAVRYEVDLAFERDGELVTKSYPGLVILRHSYE